MLPMLSKVAEIGVFRGIFSKQMLDLKNLGKLYLIDSWKNMPDYDDPLSDTDHAANLHTTLEYIKGHVAGGRFEIHIMSSLEAALEFKDGELDAIFLDANHSYDSVLQDLLAWEPKIRSGGFLMGHDFTDQHPTAIKHGWGVQKAVSQFCKERGWELTHITSEQFPSFALQRK